MHTPTTPQPVMRPPGSFSPGPVLDFGRLLIGLTVVALGILFMLDSANVLDAGRAIDRWWPVVLIAAGALTLAEHPAARARGTILVGVGALLLLFTTDVLEESAWDYVWPALVILAGVVIALRWHGSRVPGAARAEDVVRSTAVFGGPKMVCTSQALQGGWLTAIFGGIELDLRGARPAPEGASINVTCVFGGADILVPKGWRISTRSTPIFGGLDDKTDHSEPPAEDAPVLHIDAVTLFGGVDIKHGKE